MKALILAGGFARRMGQIGMPKALLPVAGRPVIEHIMDKVLGLGIDDVFVSTNKKFEKHFSEWASALPGGSRVSLIVEPALEECQKLGSVGALDFFAKETGVDDDLLVITGDNMFSSGLGGCMKFFREKASLVFGSYDTGNIEEARKLGVVLTDSDGSVTSFEEKPAEPKSTHVSTGIYIFPRGSLGLIGKYMAEKGEGDRMGDLIAWLVKRQKVYAYPLGEKWYDIGSPETYSAASKDFA